MQRRDLQGGRARVVMRILGEAVLGGFEGDLGRLGRVGAGGVGGGGVWSWRKFWNEFGSLIAQRIRVCIGLAGFCG